MTTVYLGVGQCGNQILGSFLSTCIERNPNAACVYGHEKKCRAVFVDSELKVLSRLRSSKNLRKYLREENIVHGLRGRGSNWSYGYHGCDGESHLIDKTMKQLRNEVEKCDSLSVIQIFHSLAGGTGSGLGSRLSEAVRDEYGIRFILHSIVSPHSHGESPLQTYNATLCLAHLLDSCDGILHFYNDHLLQQLVVDEAESSRPTQDSINSVLSQQLADLLTPCTSLYHHKRYLSANQEPFELIRSVCPMPEAKLINLVSAVRRSRSTTPTEWTNLCDQLCANGRAAVSMWQCSEDLLRSTLSAVCVARGDSSKTFPSQMGTVEKKLRKAIRPVAWNELPVEFWNDPSGSSPSLTLAFNSASTSAGFLRGLAARSSLKLSAGAYLHWYERHGTSKMDLMDACEKLEKAAEFYNWLTYEDDIMFGK